MSYDVIRGDGTATVQSKPMGRLIDYNTSDNQIPSAWRTLDSEVARSVDNAPAIPATPAPPYKPGKKGDNKARLRRDEMRRKILNASSAADGMIAAADGGDQTRVSNLTYKIRDILQDLWELRNDREDDWGDILNTLQVTLEGEELGELTVDQCKAIKEVIVDHLSLHEVDGTDVEESVLTLVKSGLDPWRGASGDERAIRAAIDEVLQ